MKKKIFIFLASLMIILLMLGAFIFYNNQKQNNKNGEIGSNLQKEDNILYTISYDFGLAHDVKKELDEGELLLDSDTFEKEIIQVQSNLDSIKFFIGDLIDIDENDELMLYFEAKADASSSIELEIDDGKKDICSKYYVNVQPTAYYVPIKEIQRLSNIRIINNSKNNIAIGNMKLYRCNLDDLEYINGSFNLDDYIELDLTKDCVSYIADEKLQDTDIYLDLLAVGSINSLKIYSISNKNAPELLGGINGLGTIRRIKFLDENFVYVASREYGVFIVDISDYENIKIASHIDTLELASGLDVCDDYLFIASRYYGIEIYDISDRYKPVYVSSIKSDVVSERIDCAAHNGKLYVSIWATRKIEVYDVKDVSKPVYLGYVMVDGNAYGLDFKEDYLVVSTGFHSDIYSKNKSLGYGMGNGIIIYDVSEESAMPALISTIRTDGRYYNIGRDYWNVKVYGNYAYMSDFYNGIHIYDISDCEKPRLVTKIVNNSKKNDEGYTDISSDSSVYAFDSTMEYNGCLTCVSCADGYLYVCDENEGLYTLAFKEANDQKYIDATNLQNKNKNCYESDYIIDNYDVKTIKIEEQTFCLAEYDGYFFAGTSKGIVTLNRKLEIVNEYETNSAVRDIKCYEGYIYTAEGLDGIAIYAVNDGNLEELSRYVVEESNRADYCSQIAVSTTQDYLVVVARLNVTVLLNIQDINNIHVERWLNSGATYYRNLANVGQSIYISHSIGISELIFKEDRYIYNEIYNNEFYYSSGNFAAIDENKILAICKKGFSILDVTYGANYVQNEGDVKLEGGVQLKGIPAVKDNILVVSYSHEGKITVVDITDTLEPKVLADLNIEGVPDTALICEDNTILVPARYEGIIVIKEKSVK